MGGFASGWGIVAGFLVLCFIGHAKAQPLGTPVREFPDATGTSATPGQAEGVREDIEPAPSEDADGVASIIEELTYEQWPGLPPAASKVYFTDRRYAISGFGEQTNTFYLGDVNREGGDMELYNTQLYRFVVYGAFRATDWLVLYAEVFAELFQDGLREVDHEIFLESFADFIISKPFNLRLGWSQIPMGYVNNNDEPIMFYSVNRPDVERLILPSQWIDLSATFYGAPTDRFTWMLSVFQGVDGEQLLGSTWIRRGREMRFNFDTPGVAGQINVQPWDALQLSFSGLYMESGNRADVEWNGEEHIVRAPTVLLSGYVRYELDNWSLLLLGTMGWMGETDLMYELTRRGDQGAQVLGARTYGYYAELGCDILPYLRGRSPSRPSGTWLYRTDELKLPLFVRYERLDTHSHIDPALQARLDADAMIFRSNLDILTFGVNFNPRRNLVLKANYQVRRNRAVATHMPAEADRFEVGMGFIF